MSRVRENQQREAERVAEQKRLEKDNARKDQQKNEQFARTLTGKRQAQTKAQTQTGQKQVTQKHDNPGQKIAKQAAGQSALLARQGIASNQFAAKLAQTGFQAVTQTKAEGSNRNEDIRETKDANEKQNKVERKEEGSRQDKVEKISRDDSQGGGNGAMSGESESENPQDNPAAALAANQAEGPKTSQGPTHSAPKLPEALIHELVKRVLVGCDTEGLSQFHIEFKNEILGGVRLEISADAGKIKAKFVTEDINVGRLLKASEGQLARAFGHKGLQLERLEVEGP